MTNLDRRPHQERAGIQGCTCTDTCQVNQCSARSGRSVHFQCTHQCLTNNCITVTKDINNLFFFQIYYLLFIIYPSTVQCALKTFLLDSQPHLLVSDDFSSPGTSVIIHPCAVQSLGAFKYICIALYYILVTAFPYCMQLVLWRGEGRHAELYRNLRTQESRTIRRNISSNLSR